LIESVRLAAGDDEKKKALKKLVAHIRRNKEIMKGKANHD
jgi:hypothetical protein